MDNSEKKEKYFSWEDILNEIRKNIGQIILFGIGGLVFVLLIMLFFITPKYTATTDILVSQKTNNDAMQWNAQQTDLQAINTYKDVLKKNIILEPALKELKKKDNYQGNINSLSKDISVSNEVNSLVISINAKAKSPTVAADIANTVGKVFAKKVKKMMQVDNVTIVSDAKVNSKPVSPNKKLFALAGVVLGLFIGVAIAFIKEFTDKTIKDSSFLTDELGLTNIGSVYHLDINEDDYGTVKVIDRNKISKNNSAEEKISTPRRRRV